MDKSEIRLPNEILDIIFKYTDNEKNVIPFFKYISPTTVEFLLRNVEFQKQITNENIPLLKILSGIPKYNKKLNWNVWTASSNIPSNKFLKEFGKKINWKTFTLHNLSMPVFILREFKKDLNWPNVSLNIDDNLIEEFKDLVSWKIISNRKDLSFNTIDIFNKELNFSTISANYILPINLIRKFADKINWDIVSNYIPYACTTEFTTKINWDIISKRSDLKWNFITNHDQMLNWDIISKLCNIEYKYIFMHRNQINWDVISFNKAFKYHVNQPYIDTCKNYINWNLLRQYDLTEEFITINAKYINFNLLNLSELYKSIGIHYHSEKSQLSTTFLNQFADKLDWHFISRTQTTTLNFCKNFYNYINWEIINNKKEIEWEILVEFPEKINWKKASVYVCLFTLRFNRVVDYVDWAIISKRSDLTDRFANKYIEYLILDQDSNSNLEAIITKFPESADWKNISKRTDLSNEFIRKFSYKFNWSIISNRKDLSENFVENFADLIKWYKLNVSQFSVSFCTKFKDNIVWNSKTLYNAPEHLIIKFIDYINIYDIKRKLTNKFTNNFMMKFYTEINLVHVLEKKVASKKILKYIVMNNQLEKNVDHVPLTNEQHAVAISKFTIL